MVVCGAPHFRGHLQKNSVLSVNVKVMNIARIWREYGANMFFIPGTLSAVLATKKSFVFVDGPQKNKKQKNKKQ
jgi:hypothetical protein